MALFHNLPEALRNRPQQAATDKNSFRTYRDWRVRNGEVNLPESELRNQFATNSDGSIGAYKATTPFIHEAVGNGALKRDYSNIRVPILAVFAMPAKNSYEPKDAQERAAIEAFDAATKGYVRRWKKNLQSAPGGVRIVDLGDTNHYVFISNEAEVLRETRTFVEGLH